MRAFLFLTVAVLAAIGVGIAVEPHQASPVKEPYGYPANVVSPAPFSLARWDTEHYPGLNCGTDVSGSIPFVVEQVVAVAVSGENSPVALVEVSCALNHLYAHLYVFVQGQDATHPQLLQRLTPAGTWLWQDIGLTTSRDRITLKGAGTPAFNSSSFRGLCCPDLVSLFQWRWTGSRFIALPAKAIHSLVVPNVVGRDVNTAGQVLASAGFPGISVEGAENVDPNLIVESEHPHAGTVVHSPFPGVTIYVKSP